MPKDTSGGSGGTGISARWQQVLDEEEMADVTPVTINGEPTTGMSYAPASASRHEWASSLRKSWQAVLDEEGMGEYVPRIAYGQPTVGIDPPIHEGDMHLSVIVPCYNQAAYLREGLESVLENDQIDMEVVVVDDGSSDTSPDIVRAIASVDPRVRLVSIPNGGYGHAVNIGLSEARGVYVAIFEPGDYVLPHMYDELVKMAERSMPGDGDLPDVMKSSYWRVLRSGTLNETRMHCSYYKRVRHSDGSHFTIAEEPELLRHHPSIWSALYRRSFLEAFGIRMIEAPGAGWVDGPFLYETLCLARSISYTDEAWYCYREDLAGSSSSGDVGLLSAERWNDMMDVVERLGIDDEGVLSALHLTGFRYIQRIFDEGGWDKPKEMEAVTGIFARMDLTIVPGLDAVPARLRKMAFEINGEYAPEMDDRGHQLALIREFGMTLMTDGVSGALTRTAMALDKGSRASDGTESEA